MHGLPHLWKKKKRKHKLIQNKNLFVGTEIIVNMVNEYDCDMYNMCNQMYSHMYLTTIQDINCTCWRCLLIHLWQISYLLRGSCFFEIILKNLLSVLRLTVKFKQSLKKAIFSSYKSVHVFFSFSFLCFFLFYIVLCLRLHQTTSFSDFVTNSYGESRNSPCKRSESELLSPSSKNNES